MDDELVELLKRAGIEEQRDALARGQLPLVVLPLDALLARRQARSRVCGVPARIGGSWRRSSGWRSPTNGLDVYSVPFRRRAASSPRSTSTSDGSRVPIDFASRMRASASMASYAAKLSSSVW